MACKRKLSDSDVSAVPPSNPSATVHSVCQKLLAKASDGIAFLYCSRLSDSLKTPASQVAAMYNVTVDQALEEHRRLLVVKTFMEDHGAEKISASPIMDAMWHAAILDSRLYADLQKALGCVLHHRPGGVSDREAEQRKIRLTTMEALYAAFFSTKPLGCVAATPTDSPGPSTTRESREEHKRARPAPPATPVSNKETRINVGVKTLYGNIVYFNFKNTTSIDAVKDALVG